jgi:hypothetical protein
MKMQKVEEHYHKQGITRGTPANQRSGMMQNFYSGTSYGMTEGYDSWELDRVDHLYDTREDEIHSAQLQLGRAQAQAQQFNMQQSQMVPSVQPLQNQSGVQPPLQFLQMPHTPQSLPTQNSNTGVDMAMLLQFFNTMRNNGNQVTDQMVATRTGARSDPQSGPGF